MFLGIGPNELRHHFDRLTARRTRVRSTFSNGQGSVVNEEADADDARRLIAGVIGLAFESLRCGDHGTFRVTVSSSNSNSPFVAEITSLPSASVHTEGPMS